MFTAISHTFINVLDQDEALDFYVGKLGLDVVVDADLEFMRWLTLCVPGKPENQLVLSVPGPPMVDEASREQMRELLSKGMLPGFILDTDDCRATFNGLVERGVEVIQEPTDRFYGIDCAIRDPFGNHIRITEPKEFEGEPWKDEARQAPGT